MMPFQRNASYLHDRTVETLGLLYAMHWPYYQHETARDARKSPVHDRIANLGGVFGDVAGWERANWFAPKYCRSKAAHKARYDAPEIQRYY